MDMKVELATNSEEAQVVCWIFEQYLADNSLGKIAAGLEQQGIPLPHWQAQMKSGGDWQAVPQ